jgi:HPt (histidine-containing phosphotransfer) domain-containing protein
MDDYLSKPFREDDMRALLARWLPAQASGHEEGTMTDRVENLQAPTEPPASGPPSPSESPGLPPAIDTAALDALRSLQAPGKADIRERVIGLYLDETPPQLHQLRMALNSRDAGALKRAAHTIKSSSANVGAGRLSTLCRELEGRVGSENGADFGPRVEAIEAEFARARAELETLVPRKTA